MSSLHPLPTAVRRSSTVHALAAGETLFRQGDGASWIFEVEQGRLRLIRHTTAGHPIVLHTARKGEFFAEAALFARSYRCDAVAAVASRVRRYSKQQLLTAFRDDSKAGERFMAMLAHQVHALRARLEERNIGSATERVLHHLALAVGEDGGTVQMDGTLMDLAAEIGLSHEALYRTLAALEKTGTITRKRSEIVLRKPRPV